MTGERTLTDEKRADVSNRGNATRSSLVLESISLGVVTGVLVWACLGLDLTQVGWHDYAGISMWSVLTGLQLARVVTIVIDRRNAARAVDLR